MTTDLLYQLANRFVDDQNLKTPKELGFEYGLGTITEFSDCFYFDFKILNLDGQDYNGEPLAGAPGFIIMKGSNAISIITFGKLAELRRRNK